MEAALAAIQEMEAELVQLRKRRNELELESKAACARNDAAVVASNNRGLGPFPALHHLVETVRPAEPATSSASFDAPKPSIFNGLKTGNFDGPKASIFEVPKTGIFDDTPQGQMKRRPDVPSGGQGSKRRKLEAADWDEFWKDLLPVTVLRDPATEGMPTNICFTLSKSVPVSIHGLFFHMMTFGELESVGVMNDMTCYAQFVRPRDAHRAQRACHLKALSHLGSLMHLSGIDVGLAASCTTAVSFQSPVSHANALVVFEPAPFEDRICTLVRRFWSAAQARQLQAGRRRLLFFQFSTPADTQAALITLQLRLAFDWDIHLQYVTETPTLFGAPEFRSTAEALEKSHPFLGGGGGPPPGVSPPDLLRNLVRQIQVGSRYKGVVTKVAEDVIVVNIHVKVHATVHVKDCDDSEAFRLLKVGDIIAPEVKDIVRGLDNAPEIRMALQRPERCKPLAQRATLDALEQQKQALLTAARPHDPARPRLIYAAVRATYLQWAVQAVRDLQLSNGTLEQFFNDYPDEAALQAPPHGDPTRHVVRPSEAHAHPPYPHHPPTLHTLQHRGVPQSSHAHPPPFRPTVPSEPPPHYFAHHVPPQSMARHPQIA